MNRSKLFGRHLYNQIVYPLLAASVIVGIVATIVAVYFLEDLTSKWVTEAARNATENIGIRYSEHVLQMQREAKLCAGDEPLLEALEANDGEALRARMLAQNAALSFDGMVVLDAGGRVVDAVGIDTAEPGSVLFSSTPPVAGPTPSCAVTKDLGAWAIVVFQPIPGAGESRVLAVAHRIDDELLGRLGVGKDRAFCFYGPDYRDLACLVGTGFDDADASALLAKMDDPESEIALAVRGGVEGSAPPPASFRVDDTSFRFWVEPLSLPFPHANDDNGYIVGIVSEAVSQEASDTSRNLIAIWSLVAVAALVGLGGWIARRVSDPLVDLSEGARRIAEGDFTTKMDVRGANEVSELAATFNTMTDSLRERSDSLTKKVLELATLYEMSRSLGSTLDMDELLGSVLDSALRIFGLDLGYVVLRDKDNGSLALRALRGVEGSSADGAVRSSMSEWVVREGRPLIFNPDASSQHGQMDSVTGAKAALCVPLISAEGTIGSITIGSSGPDYRFSSDDVRLLSTIANHVTIAIGNIELFSSLQEAYLATVRSLAAAVDAKDTYTRGHSDRVATYATMIAERMGLNHEQRIALEMAAYLHDIGKIGVREEILLKPGRLDDEEMAQMRHHPLIGANILKPVAFPWAITPVVRHHHESYDGSGYPAGLKGEEIPLLARILTVADSYEAMTADRPYRAGRDMHEAIEELRGCAGHQFDPAVVETFAAILLEFEEAGEAIVGSGPESIAPEEARAIFAALADGVFASFRRLGGPRLSSNVEHEVDEYFSAEGVPFRVVNGRVVYTRDPGPDMDEEIAVMRTALRRIDAAMGRVSGTTLVDHFYTDAFEGFSSRMRVLAVALDFYRFG